jgi:pyridoxine/pyridoxamine 5'-phosphate oxidase
LGRGLGDPHGVDESVRDEQEEVHFPGHWGGFRIAGRGFRRVNPWGRACIYCD